MSKLLPLLCVRKEAIEQAKPFLLSCEIWSIFHLHTSVI